MLVPIPSDWNGEDWICVQIEWPDSDEWIGLLTGILSLLTRGRYWDEDTGSIKDVQEIAWEIFNRAYPFVSCDGDELPPVEPEIIARVCGALIMGENEMGQVVTDITIEGGVLYKWFGPCCKVPVPGDITTIVNPPPEVSTPEPDPGGTWACNKAAGMALVFYGALDAAITAMGAVENNARAQALIDILPQFNISGEVAADVAAAYTADPTGNFELKTDTDTEAKIRCSWGAMLEDTDTLTSAEFSTMQSALSARFTATQAAFMVEMMIALREQNFAWWARSYHDTVADCTCPEETTYEGLLHFTGEFTADAPGEFSMVESNNGKVLDITWNAPSGAFVSEDNLFCTVSVDEAIDQVKFRIQPLAGSNMPTEAWVPAGSCPVTDPAQWVEVHTNQNIGATTAKTVISGGYEWEEDYPAPRSPIRVEWAPRKCGESTATPAATLQWRIEVIEVNSVPV